MNVLIKLLIGVVALAMVVLALRWMLREEATAAIGSTDDVGNDEKGIVVEAEVVNDGKGSA